MIFSVSALIALAGFLVVIALWVFKEERTLELKRKVERQLIRKESKNFNVLEGLGFGGVVKKLQLKITKAGLKWHADEVMVVVVLLMIFLITAGLVLNLGTITLVLVVLPVIFLNLVLKKIGERRLRKIEEELEYVLHDIISSLRVIKNLVHAVEVAEQEAREPLKSELKEIVNEVKTGANLEKALDDFSKRADSVIVESWVDSIIFAKKAGVGMVECCERTVGRIKDKNSMRREVIALSSGAKGTAIGIMVIMALFMGGMAGTSKEYVKALMSPMGKGILAYAAGSYLLAGIFIFKIIDKEVNE